MSEELIDSQELNDLPDNRSPAEEAGGDLVETYLNAEGCQVKRVTSPEGTVTETWTDVGGLSFSRITQQVGSLVKGPQGRKPDSQRYQDRQAKVDRQAKAESTRPRIRFKFHSAP